MTEPSPHNMQKSRDLLERKMLEQGDKDVRALTMMIGVPEDSVRRVALFLDEQDAKTRGDA